MARQFPKKELHSTCSFRSPAPRDVVDRTVGPGRDLGVPLSQSRIID